MNFNKILPTFQTLQISAEFARHADVPDVALFLKQQLVLQMIQEIKNNVMTMTHDELDTFFLFTEIGCNDVSITSKFHSEVSADAHNFDHMRFKENHLRQAGMIELKATIK